MGGAHHTFCMEAHMFCMESGSKSGKLWLAPLIAPRPINATASSVCAMSILLYYSIIPIQVYKCAE